MRASHWPGYVLTACLSTLFAAITGFGWDTGDVINQVPEAQYKASGLHRLSAAEQVELQRILINAHGPSYLEPAAAAFMLDRGYLPAELTGAVIWNEPEGRRQLLGRRNGLTYLLNPPFIDHPPDPGVYWTRTVGRSWTVLLPDANEVSLYVAEELD